MFELVGNTEPEKVTELLRKWLFGGRLTRAERAAISHVLPLKEKKTATGYLKGADEYGNIGIARRTFFRWKKVGENCPGGLNLPPFDEPERLEYWYDQMRDLGMFKHRFPREVGDAIASLGIKRRMQNDVPDEVGAEVPENAKKTEENSATASSASRGQRESHGVKMGLAYEIQNEEVRVADLRVARDKAAAAGDLAEARSLSNQYSGALNDLTVIKKRALDLLEKEKKLIDKEEVKADLGKRITGIVVGGMFLYQRILPQLEAELDPAARNKVWKRAWQEHCSPLMQCEFGPEWLPRVSFELWERCEEWLRDQLPPSLELDAA